MPLLIARIGLSLALIQQHGQERDSGCLADTSSTEKALVCTEVQAVTRRFASSDRDLADCNSDTVRWIAVIAPAQYTMLIPPEHGFDVEQWCLDQPFHQ